MGRATRLAVLIVLLVAPALRFGLGLATAAEPSADRQALEFFERDVRPLLASRCHACHGPKTQKAKLRLDSRAAVMAGGESGPAIVPGKPAESLLVDAINYGELYRMPPKAKLPPAEIATLTRWVEMGAPWPSDPSGHAASAKASTFDLAARREAHWCWRPVRVVAPPTLHNGGWPANFVDRYILAALEARGMNPAPEADRRTLYRRLSFDLTGLPPPPADVEAFVADPSPSAYDAAVERLLASPRYGERWARHWLDLVRFAETAGHEFDYDVPDAYRYRDYVIRAFNRDVPYDRFVIEHVAGDLLDPPRRHPSAGFNESVLGTGFFFLGEGVHSPVDLREDEAARIDNQIDVLSKTFLGLTVACARCHDHKFDAISTKDYYALYGYLRSARHQHAFIDPPQRIAARAAELSARKDAIAVLLGPLPAAPPPAAPAGSSVVFEDFDGPSWGAWSATGDAFGAGPSGPGAFRLAVDGDAPRAWPVAPGQAHSGLVSDRLQGVLRSPSFTIDAPYIHYLASGRAGRVNLVIDGFEKIRSPIYGGLSIAVDSDRPRWYAQDVTMWRGHRAYVELADGAVVEHASSQTRYADGDGFLAVDEIRFSTAPALSAPRALAAAPVDLQRFDDPRLRSALAAYRACESALPRPALALAIIEGTGEDERVHVRGNPHALGDAVPRRFLEALGGLDTAPREGRLELARRIVDPRNPLFARVLVNRLWMHHFGAGIVPTPDDFGVMGQPPTHAELLDALAARFVAEGWSIKAMHRLIVGSRTYRMSSRQDDAAAERIDPANRLLHRQNVRRLEAESIRDALLAHSGRLDPRMFGPSVPPYLTSFMDGRGRPAASGPLDGDGRRSLYLNVRRNFLNPMFLAFDFPVPFSTMGRRNVSNVPAQALTLLNDPLVVDQSAAWARRIVGEGAGLSRSARIEQLYLSAFGRPPTSREAAAALAFLDAEAADVKVWTDLCHVLLNVKEFIYIE